MRNWYGRDSVQNLASPFDFHPGAENHCLGSSRCHNNRPRKNGNSYTTLIE
jgi:hypothetical protein